MAEVKNSSVISNVKLWVFPSLVTILAMMIWRDVSELKSDVKQLLAESASNKAKVEILENQVQQLNQAVFKIPRTAGNFPKPSDDKQINETYAILNKDEYGIIKKYVPYKTN